MPAPPARPPSPGRARRPPRRQNRRSASRRAAQATAVALRRAGRSRPAGSLPVGIVGGLAARGLGGVPAVAHLADMVRARIPRLVRVHDANALPVRFGVRQRKSPVAVAERPELHVVAAARDDLHGDRLRRGSRNRCRGRYAARACANASVTTTAASTSIAGRHRGSADIPSSHCSFSRKEKSRPSGLPAPDTSIHRIATRPASDDQARAAATPTPLGGGAHTAKQVSGLRVPCTVPCSRPDGERHFW